MDGELDEKSVCRKFRRTGADGKVYNTKFYNLEAVIAVGFRTNSERAIVFRQWATSEATIGRKRLLSVLC